MRRCFRTTASRPRNTPSCGAFIRASARQTLTIGTADIEAARLLRVPLNSPVAEVRRIFTTADRTVIYLGEVTYRGDFVRIDMDLRP